MNMRAAGIKVTEDDLSKAAQLFGLEELIPIGGFENLLYRSQLPDGRILRLTHTSRRSQQLIEGEFHFMDHLSRQGVPVVVPIFSIHQRLTELLVTQAGESLIVVCMTEAPGGRRQAADWTDRDIEGYGELLGVMHKSAANYQPGRGDSAQGASRRPDWHDSIFDIGLSIASGASPELEQKYQEINRLAQAHPAGDSDLLIHCDVHLGNIFITESGVITVFDFDDSAYGTATHDIALVLFYWLFGRDVDPQPELRRFLASFMTGYNRHETLPEDWFIGADLFLSKREIDLYWLLREVVKETESSFIRCFMEGRKERILTGVPYLGVPLGVAIRS